MDDNDDQYYEYEEDYDEEVDEQEEEEQLRLDKGQQYNTNNKDQINNNEEREIKIGDKYNMGKYYNLAQIDEVNEDLFNNETLQNELQNEQQILQHTPDQKLIQQDIDYNEDNLNAIINNEIQIQPIIQTQQTPYIQTTPRQDPPLPIQSSPHSQLVQQSSPITPDPILKSPQQSQQKQSFITNTEISTSQNSNGSLSQHHFGSPSSQQNKNDQQLNKILSPSINITSPLHTYTPIMDNNELINAQIIPQLPEGSVPLSPISQTSITQTTQLSPIPLLNNQSLNTHLNTQPLPQIHIDFQIPSPTQNNTNFSPQRIPLYDKGNELIVLNNSKSQQSSKQTQSSQLDQSPIQSMQQSISPFLLSQQSPIHKFSPQQSPRSQFSQFNNSQPKTLFDPQKFTSIIFNANQQVDGQKQLNFENLLIPNQSKYTPLQQQQQNNNNNNNILDQHFSPPQQLQSSKQRRNPHSIHSLHSLSQSPPLSQTPSSISATSTLPSSLPDSSADSHRGTSSTSSSQGSDTKDKQEKKKMQVLQVQRSKSSSSSSSTASRRRKRLKYKSEIKKSSSKQSKKSLTKKSQTKKSQSKGSNSQSSARNSDQTPTSLSIKNQKRRISDSSKNNQQQKRRKQNKNKKQKIVDDNQENKPAIYAPKPQTPIFQDNEDINNIQTNFISPQDQNKQDRTINKKRKIKNNKDDKMIKSKSEQQLDIFVKSTFCTPPNSQNRSPSSLSTNTYTSPKYNQQQYANQPLQYPPDDNILTSYKNDSPKIILATAIAMSSDQNREKLNNIVSNLHNNDLNIQYSLQTPEQHRISPLDLSHTTFTSQSSQQDTQPHKEQKHDFSEETKHKEGIKQTQSLQQIHHHNKEDQIQQRRRGRSPLRKDEVEQYKRDIDREEKEKKKKNRIKEVEQRAKDISEQKRINDDKELDEENKKDENIQKDGNLEQQNIIIESERNENNNSMDDTMKGQVDQKEEQNNSLQ